MTVATDLLIDGFDRLRHSVDRVVRGLSDEELAWRPAPDANPIAWLVWHLSRVQDDHVADAAGTEQVWATAGFADRFGLPFDVTATGYGFDAADVGQVRAGAGLLGEYADAVIDRTVSYIGGLADADFARVVDEGWDPPVTLGVRLLSVLNDDLQHVGQAAYVRGLLPG